MKKIFLLLSSAAALFACNDQKTTTDSVETADSINEEKLDTSSNKAATITTDAATTSFLVDAADHGMAEVELGRLAQDKGKNENVKSFAGMMVRDHSGVNDQVKSFAKRRNVTLPDSVSNSHKDKKNDLMKKEGAAFDKAYMDAMVKGHQDVVDLFEKAANNSTDDEVKTFINNILPSIKTHLDSAKSIRKRL